LSCRTCSNIGAGPPRAAISTVTNRPPAFIPSRDLCGEQPGSIATAGAGGGRCHVKPLARRHALVNPTIERIWSGGVRSFTDEPGPASTIRRA
jgi:hypothetical protein